MRYLKLLVLFVFAVAALAQKNETKKSNVKLPEGPGKALTERVCTSCHGLENVVRVRMTKDRWNSIVEDMVSRGATATDDEMDQIVNYLAANFSKPKPKEDPKP